MKKRVFAALLATLSVAALTGVTAEAATIVYVNTGTSCSSGRICLNQKAVSSCSGTSNDCYRFNANGGAYEMAWSNTGRSNAERMYNNNSGTGRMACAYKWPDLNPGGGVGWAYYGGWGILPFTGVASMQAPVVSGFCSNV